MLWACEPLQLCACFTNTRNTRHTKAPTSDAFTDKGFNASLDSFAPFFCCQCDAEKQPTWSYLDNKNIPCGSHCYQAINSGNNRGRQDRLLPHYRPCDCRDECSQQCSCRAKGICCEKLCGCPKGCSNQYRGCYCLIECQTRRCPCFAAHRECDPDVCRNCMFRAGDGSPIQTGDNHECRNMKMLRGLHQEVFVAESKISGRGAFAKNNIAKNEFIGEYTGELLTHEEAEKRPDAAYSFVLDEEFCIDALRIGSALKFANHSSDPNCYARHTSVLGNWRIGLYAKKQIKAGDELFFDYHYDDSVSPDWAKQSEAPASKKNKASSSGHTKTTGMMAPEDKECVDALVTLQLMSKEGGPSSGQRRRDEGGPSSGQRRRDEGGPSSSGPRKFAN